MKFFEVSKIFELLENEPKRLEMTKILAHFFKRTNAHEAAIVAYLSLGNVQPVYVSTQFNFAEKSMLNVLAEILDKPLPEVTAQAKKIGDLGLLYAQECQHPGADNAFTIIEVHAKLIAFLKLGGTGSQKSKEQFLQAFLEQLDPISGKYVIRAILGRLRLGFSDMTLLDAFSWMVGGDKLLRKDLEEAYNVSADIGTIIKVLKNEGIEGIKKMTIIPGVPILPAAAERMPDAKSIFERLGDCVAQPKLDGFRLQVHVDRTHDKPLIRFFSRNLQEMSEMFPDLYQAVLDLDVKTLVAEGEAIAYDIDTGNFLPFQETVKRKRKYGIESAAEDFPLKLFFFDVLFLNGVSFLDKTHHDRREALKKILDNKNIAEKSVIALIEEEKIHSAQDLEDYFNSNISQGLEGLVVKRTDALYQPGKRNFNWIKLKRQESASLDDTIDCVILGYYAGQGKRAQFGIGALLVGVYDKENDAFVTVAKIGTGLTDQAWRDQKKSCDDLKVTHQPHNIICAKELYPDVWVDPKIVCMIRADEVTKSPLHTAGKTDKDLGLALRFPRIMGYRPDKSATEATTVSELKRLFVLQFEKKSKPKQDQ